MRATLALLALILLAGPALAQDYVWLEGEKPTRQNFEVGGSGWGNQQFLSGRQWLNVNIAADQIEARCPEGGVLLEYDFRAPTAGRYEVWNRIGFEFVRSPFEWRLDQGAWATISPQDLTTDLVEISEWCEVAWIRLGVSDLGAGHHTLQIRLQPTFKDDNGVQKPNSILYASDALCVYGGEFRPNLWHEPGAAWDTDQDRAAAAQEFALPAAPGPGQRSEVALKGLWQVARYDEQEVVDRPGPTRTVPGDEAYWMSLPVPGDKNQQRPELRFCHRLAYRTRVAVPASLGGRAFILRLPCVNMIASVLVNGQYCGFTKAPYALYECDVTGALRPGQTNEICVVVKDAYYAFSERKTGKSCRMSFNVPLTWMGGRNYISQSYDFPVGTGEYAQQAGLLQAPVLVAAGGVYIADAYAKPSVKRYELGLELTLNNTRATAQTLEVGLEARAPGAAAAEKTWPAREVTVPANQSLTVELAQPWANPRLWWPDDPQLYELTTTLSAGGQVLDVQRTGFGFREWEWAGPGFKVNGVPWQFFADTTSLGGEGGAQASAALWRAHGQNMWRFWGRHFAGMEPPQTLDFMDREGIVVRRSGIFDGQGANYLNGLTDNKALFDNWITQLQAQVREERNHPSVLIWSLENEITFINSRNLGQSEVVEPEIARAGREIMALDPTRPVMVDGGNCLRDNSLPVNGVHYMESAWRDYPTEAYTLEKAFAAYDNPRGPVWTGPWPLHADRPIFMGESFFARGNTPGSFSQFGGEGCFGGWGPATRIGVGRLAKMLAEGYRWYGVAGTHFWMSEGETDLHYNAWQPVAVLCREWNWTFAGNSQVTRTLKLFNNTHTGGPLRVAWQLEVEGEATVQQTRNFDMAPGASQVFTIDLRLPPVQQRTTGTLTLTCERAGKEVYREVKPLSLLPEGGGALPQPRAAELAVIDPAGVVRDRLTARGVAFTEATGLDDLPASARVIVVGPDALTPRQATDPRWRDLAAAGARLLVLEQRSPLHFLAVPADLSTTDFAGSVAFAEDLGHPVFAGLDQSDFFTWSGDGVVYRNVYRKASRGAVSLVQCDQNLGCTALAQCPVNEGLMVLCQLVVGEKLATDPVAQRLFDNLLTYCDEYRLERRRTAVAMPPDTAAFRLLQTSGLQFDAVADPVAALTDGQHEIVVFDANPTNLRELAAASAQVRAFTARGGWLMAWGLTREGLDDFNRLVGVEHLLRPFELERVAFAETRDPLAAGLTVRDITMESAEQIFPWAGDKYLVDDEFTDVVDLADVAPFCGFPGATAGDKVAARNAAAGWSRNMVNGFTSADAWKLIHYMSTANPRITLTLPRPEVLDRLSIILNTHYCVPTTLNLYYDGETTPVALKVQPNGERQDLDLEPRTVRRLTIELADFNKTGETTGIDNLWLHAVRSDDWRARVKPLLNIGGLVKYPMGRGGLILNQLNVRDSEPVPDNLQKKRTIASTLLRNLNATFAGGEILATSALEMQPLPLDVQCNQYLTRDRGWYDGGRDMAALPHGEVLLDGVLYSIRDFKTSPVPSCVMLAGPGARGQLPGEVRGLSAGARADALFFLHTFNRVQDWRPNREGDAPPVVFRYVVNYEDGQQVEVPIVYGEGVDHWISRDPAGLKSASVAWSSPFPGDDSGDQAVLYQFQWNNPRPEVPIASVDMLYGNDGSRWGAPALIALTAGRARATDQ